MAVKYIFLLGVLFAISEAALESKRDVDCNVSEPCSFLLDITVGSAIYIGTADDFLSYCGTTCIEPLYNFFTNCEEGAPNATQFDFYCSRNTAGDSCQQFVVANAVSDPSNSVLSHCISSFGGTCTAECRAALDAASSTAGCCLYSWLAVVIGKFTTDLLFQGCNPALPRSLCIGGASNATIALPSPPVNVDPRCVEFAEEVDETCRSFLSDGAIYTGSVCSNECGEEVYEYFQKCDNAIGGNNGTLLDVLCAKDSAGERCYTKFLSLADIDLEACGDFSTSCPTACREELMKLTDLGCCASSIYSIGDGGGYFDILARLCGVDLPGKCIGEFSNEAAPPAPEAMGECALLELSVPDECKEYTSIDYLTVLAYADQTQFQGICEGPCARSLYDYFVHCDRIRGSRNASFIDFLCSKNDAGRTCAGLFSDLAIGQVLNTTCSETTDKMCSSACQVALQPIAATYGCCLFTLAALDDNVTYTTSVVRTCNINLDSVCTGGLSGQPIAAPGQVPAGPIEAMCQNQLLAIPDDCLSFLSYDALFYNAFIDSDDFLENFCDSNCAEPVYDYINECVNKTNAAEIDFICAKAPSGTNCVNLITDVALHATIEGVCADATDKQCSEACQSAIAGFERDYGCCLYSYSALDTNVTFTNGLFAQCGLSNRGLCTGGISNEAINAPGTETAAGATAIASTLLLMLAFILTLFM